MQITSIGLSQCSAGDEIRFPGISTWHLGNIPRCFIHAENSRILSRVLSLYLHMLGSYQFTARKRDLIIGGREFSGRLLLVQLIKNKSKCPHWSSKKPTYQPTCHLLYQVETEQDQSAGSLFFLSRSEGC